MRTFVAILLAIGWVAGVAHAQEKITFGTDWLAEAEYGGY